MAATVLTVEAAKAANLPIIEGARKYRQAVFDSVIAIRADRRSGTASTKTRGEVAGSNAKPWRQKGTGRARAGEKRSPIWRGGGVVFGPKPRDYSHKVNKKVTKAALSRAFSDRVANGDVLVVDSFSVPEGKTKQIVALLGSLSPEAKTLVIAPKFDELTLRAGRNVPGLLLLSVGETNTEDLLYFKKIIVTNDALPHLAARLAIKK
jgi:large subunit ribosomal protein L4